MKSNADMLTSDYFHAMLALKNIEERVIRGSKLSPVSRHSIHDILNDIIAIAENGLGESVDGKITGGK